MLEPILQSLREVEGVQGAMVIDHAATVIAHRAHTIYDLGVLQQVARSVISGTDSVQLIQDDWDVLTAHYGDGKLLLRSLRIAGSRPRQYVLVVIADATLNVAFLGVALRVAASKLLAELEAGAPAASPPVSAPPSATASSTASPASRPSSAAMSSAGPSSAVPVPVAPMSGRGVSAEPSRPELARSGFSWSGSGVGSSVSHGDVGVSDVASSKFLSACTRALGVSAGPMARVFVREAVRRVCGERPFSRADGPALIAQLASGIEDIEDRAMFQRATRSL